MQTVAANYHTANPTERRQLQIDTVAAWRPFVVEAVARLEPSPPNRVEARQLGALAVLVALEKWDPADSGFSIVVLAEIRSELRRMRRHAYEGRVDRMLAVFEGVEEQARTLANAHGFDAAWLASVGLDSFAARVRGGALRGHGRREALRRAVKDMRVAVTRALAILGTVVS